MAGPTVIPTYTAQEFAQRVARLFPNGWASLDAKQSGGVLFSRWQSTMTGSEFTLAEVQYAANAQRMQTETSPELDLASMDFFGDALPRPPGMSDALFFQLIQANLFKKVATRGAISAAIQAATGVQPRMMEPWNPGDTGAWDGPSYWDVDMAATPFRWSAGERYFGFIITAPPIAQPALNGNPVPSWDDGIYWDVAGGFFGNVILIGNSNLFSLVNSIRAFGTTAGMKIQPGFTGP